MSGYNQINAKNMKKTFKLTHSKIKYPRLIDAAKHEVKKYLRRERNKKLPEGADFLDFDCKYGNTESEAKTIHLTAINKHIDKAAEEKLESFYLEVLAKPGIRSKKENEQENEKEN
jgi:hypothetical protein